MRVVILCGGSGSRLWPISRKSLPKQFVNIFNGKSLLDLTIKRVLRFNLKKKPIFVCNKDHGFLVRDLLTKHKLNAEIFLEPEGKNTCAAIYLVAKYCDNSEDLLIMPSDHLISDENKFINEVLQINKDLLTDNWITLGIKPTKPSQAYGYIKISTEKILNLYKVKKFIEKPSYQNALKFFKEKNFYWNAGIFIAKASTIIRSVKDYEPNIAKNCNTVYRSIKKIKYSNEYTFSPNLFAKIPSKSIDYAVMEYAENIYLHPLNSDWSDVGSWDSIAETYQVNLQNKNIIQIESDNNYIKNDKRTIATIGVRDLIVIDTDDATLITKKKNSEKVKLVVDKLIKNGSFVTTNNVYENRPWGKFEILLESKFCKVKRLVVHPNKRLSLQYHNFRSEHWLIVSGKAKIHLDNKNFILTPGQSIDIPMKSRHYIENKEKKDLIIIETQLGTYFGEDDIIRIDDPYSRLQ